MIAAMGSLGREMAALPQVKEDVVMGDAVQEIEASVEEKIQSQPQTQTQQNTAGKKKKKGKK